MSFMKKKYQSNTFIASIGKLFSIYLTVLLASCSIPDIGKEYTPNEYQARSGDSVTLSWHYLNAERVYVDTIKTPFDPIDSLRVLAEYSREYVVRAYQGNIDSLIDRKVLIVDGQTVDNNSQASDFNSQNNEIITPDSIELHQEDRVIGTTNNDISIQRGPIKPFPQYTESQSLESEYFTGISNGSNGAELLRVTRTISEKSNKGWKIYLRAVLLDKFGNFVKKNFRIGQDDFSLEYGCDDQKFSKVTYSDSKLVMPPVNSGGCDFSILLDNSAAVQDNDRIIAALGRFSENLTQQDRVQFSVFNQNYNQLIPMQSPETAISQFNSISIETPNGLNSLYKSVYKNVEQFPKSNNCRALVVITHYNDNSSLVYTAADLINISKSADVPIYIIAVGDALRTYFLNYICGSSGGKLYHIFEDEADNIPSILNEIAFSLKNYYQIEFNIFDLPSDIVKTGKAGKCDELQTTLILNSDGEELKTNVNIFPHPIPEYSQYQAVAMFDDKSSDIIRQYYPLMDSLAVTLLDNPDYSIELIGNSSNEGDQNYNLDISAKRAEKVKSYLVAQGVPEKQLITKAKGYTKPIYFNPRLPWQESFNRRVEIRWLEPNKYPYEIVAGDAESEDKAQYLEDTWRKRGYRSYYERIIDNDQAKYLIKLWGYTSLNDAKSTIEVLQKKYKKDSFYLE